MILFILHILKILAMVFSPMEPLLSAFMPISLSLFWAWALVDYVSDIYIAVIIAFTLVWIITPWTILAKSRTLRLIGLWTILLLNLADLLCIIFSPFSLMKIVGLLFNVTVLSLAALKLFKEGQSK